VPQSTPEYNYEVISRFTNFIIIFYDGDFTIGSIKLDSQEKIDEWIAKLEKIEMKKRSD
jgi:hypothetical protein